MIYLLQLLSCLAIVSSSFFTYCANDVLRRSESIKMQSRKAHNSRKKEHSNIVQSGDGYDGANLIREAGASLFLPENKRTKKFYGKHWLRYNFRTLVNMKVIHSVLKRAFFIYGFDYTKRDGAINTDITRSSSRIEVTPLIVGFRYLFPFHRRFSFSTDFALYYPMVRIYNSQNVIDNSTQSFVDDCVSRSTPGLLFQGNLSCYLASMFSLNLHVNYTYAELGPTCSPCPDTVKDHKLNISGVNVGASLGFYF